MISIIIPIKGHRIVSRLLDTLINQEIFLKHEIIVVDAQPTLTLDLQKKYKNIIWIKKFFSNTESVPEQRNYGIKKAKGDVIVFIDADCIPSRNWLSNLTKPILEKKEKVTCGYVKSVRPYPIKVAIDHENYKKNKYVGFAPTMNSAFSKEIFESVGYYDSRFIYGAEDVDFCMRILKKGYKIRYCFDAVIYHDWGNISRNINRAYGYGKANYLLFDKYKDEILKSKKNAYNFLAYPIFIIFFPITFLVNFYPLFLIVPLIKTYIDTKSIRYSFESIFFNSLHAIGFLSQVIIKTLE
jgi:GT2 family glycosyltransferase